MNIRDIEQIKRTCQTLLNQLNVPNRRDTLLEKWPIDFSTYHPAMVYLIRGLQRQDQDVAGLIQLSEKFLQITEDIPRNKAHPEFIAFAEQVERLKKIADEVKNKYLLISDQQAILKKHLTIQDQIKEKIEKEKLSIQQIQLLNEIQQYQSELQVDRNTYQFDGSQPNQGVINSIQKGYESYAKQLQSEIEISLDSFISQILRDINDVQETDRLFASKTMIIRLDNELKDESQLQAIQEESKTATDYVEKQSLNVEKLKNNMRLIASMSEMNRDLLSAASQCQIRNLLAFKDDMSQQLTKTKKNMQVIEGHAKLQGEVNDEQLKIIQEMDQDRLIIEETKAKFDSLNHPLITQADTEKSLYEKIERELQTKHKFEKHDKQLLNVQNRLTGLRQSLIALSETSYSDGRPIKFSDEFKNKLESTRKRCDDLVNECTILQNTASIHLRYSDAGINTINDKIVKLISLEDKTKTGFGKIDGPTLENIKKWIKKTKHYQAILHHQSRTTQKNEAISDFSDCLNQCKNLDALMNILSPSYREEDNYYIHLKNKKTNVNTNMLDKRLRKTTSRFRFFRLSGYKSTTDKHLSLLEEAIYTHLKNEYKVDLPFTNKKSSFPHFSIGVQKNRIKMNG